MPGFVVSKVVGLQLCRTAPICQSKFACCVQVAEMRAEASRKLDLRSTIKGKQEYMSVRRWRDVWFVGLLLRERQCGVGVDDAW